MSLGSIALDAQTTMGAGWVIGAVNGAAAAVGASSLSGLTPVTGCYMGLLYKAVSLPVTMVVTNVALKAMGFLMGYGFRPSEGALTKIALVANITRVATTLVLTSAIGGTAAPLPAIVAIAATANVAKYLYLRHTSIFGKEMFDESALLNSHMII